ncbi:phospholipase A2 inhibitor gamma subunit B-like [Lissotriton helveticus]
MLLQGTVRAAPLLTWILAAILVEGEALSCVECTSNIDCTTPSVTCPSPSDICYTKYTETTSDGVLKKEYVRGCGQYSAKCNKVQSMTAPYIEIRGNSTCCTTDNCHPDQPTVPTTGTTLNGVTCRICLSVTSTYCYTADSMKCSGIQTMCAFYGIRTRGVTNSDIAFRGCASPDFCFIGTFTSTVNGSTSDGVMGCSNGAIRPEHGLLFTAFTLLLLKLLH